MPKTPKDALFDLVKSLSKSEKRQFKLYAGRLGVNEDAKFMALFDILEKLSVYSESEILKHKEINKRQLSNLKAHLYKQILISLRLNPMHQNVRLQIREQLDFATILYHKGLYNQSLKLLEKAKAMAFLNEEKNMAYEIIELEKVIESQYITRSISNRADALAIEAKNVSRLNVITSKLSNLSLQLYGIFLKKGYVKNDEEYQEITHYFNAHLPKFKPEEMGFREKLWWYKAHLWYSFLIQDFLSCYRYALKWTDLFYENPAMIVLNPVFFIRGKQYLLEALFFIQDVPRFKEALEKFEEALEDANFPVRENVQSLAFLYRYSHKLNLHFMEGTFHEGLALVHEVLEGIDAFEDKLDEHHVMIFYYKIACLYFGVADYRKCIEYLHKIISNKSLEMREDLLCYSRILNLVSHYEAGLDYHLERLIKSTYKFLIKMEDLYQVQREMIKFLRNLGEIYPHEIKNEFKKLHAKLKAFEDDPYERRSFLYLDIISWLESNIEGRSIPEIIQEKALARK
ncbi:MAG TPA: hypothetical protein PKW08_01885 [Flavobacteriaceae bacterium]|nr:hypothetical protein [Flavobacteriaceae bacterium]MCB9213038.1 hypothetical protein [Alteromonas sp.]HPF10943.1 hypothetical protein [Flavobacteriaceae bacterium]HQU20315.1 hypothetical protein [Flavobacteriaceae bacterium]HQU64207.1 hypothetical protein [Flavobacteriaceae bacterium]